MMRRLDEKKQQMRRYGYLIVPMSLPSISFRHFQHLQIPPMLQTRVTVRRTSVTIGRVGRSYEVLLTVTRNSYPTASLQLPNCKKKSAAHKNGFEVLVIVVIIILLMLVKSLRESRRYVIIVFYRYSFKVSRSTFF